MKLNLYTDLNVSCCCNGTCRYWSSRREAWPRMIPEGSTVSKVFGSRAYERYRYDLTLLEATSQNDDKENVFARLVKESTAALINSYTRKGYPYSGWEVKTAVIQGLVSEEAAVVQANKFYDANRNCNWFMLQSFFIIVFRSSRFELLKLWSQSSSLSVYQFL